MAAPIHNNGGKKDKLWRDALMVAIKRPGEDGRPLLTAIAERCALAAADGDIQAMREIGDRIDGKATEFKTTEVNVTFHDARKRVESKLARVIDGRAEEELPRLIN